jgi:hypothetical protein
LKGVFSIKQIKKYHLWGIIFIVAFSSLMHFVFDLSGKSKIVGAIAPVNESLWEHLKMPLLPIMLWWIITYFILKRQINNLEKWILCGMISSLITILFIAAFYYTYTGAFGIHSVVLDILSLIIGVILGQLVALKIYTDLELKTYHYLIIYIIFLSFVFMFIIFTYKTPHLPLFKGQTTGSYGLN